MTVKYQQGTFSEAFPNILHITSLTDLDCKYREIKVSNLGD